MKNSLKIYNTLSNKKDAFKPVKAKKVNIFVCGPTVYDYSHLGHARNYVFFDVFVKYLRFLGYEVFYLQNITDVDDKIIARAREKEVPAKDLAVAFEKEYIKDMKSIGVTSVSKYARATNYIKEIVSQISRLEKKDFTYSIEGDGVYFDISKFKDYGKLAGRTALDAEDSVSRIDYSKDKRNRGDFCLWKFKQQENEPSWKSPWGEGRPGWHIEDTAISEKFFGPQYDIHGGGRDLIFPHHEAEVSQMEAVSGKNPMAKYWMHVGFLTVNGQKMSKSLGNFIILNDFIRRYPVNYVRFFIVKNLWSSPIDYSESMMISVASAVEKIEEFLRKIKGNKSKIKNTKENSELIKNLRADFFSQLDDDSNTPKAFAVLFDLIKKVNKLLEKDLISKKESAQIYKFFEEINKIFGIVDFKKAEYIIPSEIKRLAEAREKYRKNQEWEKADKARIEMEKKGFAVEDTKDGLIIKKN
jgi:cysteinyl-tRNA synthetase